MRCAEAVRLERQLRECQSAHEEVRQRLERGMGSLSRHDYSALSNPVDEARTAVEQARDALEGHGREHSCLAKNAAR